ncbi:MAG: Omp28-related outer membrane protein [Crocinitomicaceae bacterium]|nr:Omp28-related outer membrane protein [Crocinitomicaceae bacterium]
MKKIYLLVAGLAAFNLNAQLFSDNFDAYTAGQYLGPQSLTWSTWSGTEGGNEDVQISSTNASSAPNAIYFSSTAANGGPQDVVLKFGQLYNSGVFTLQNKFYVNAGKKGYYNIQGALTIGNLWALNVNLNSGQLTIDDGITPNLVVSSYPESAWFELKIEANLTLHVWKAYVNGNLVGTWVNGVNTVASADFFPVQNTQMYIDDVMFDHVPFTVPALDAMVADIDMGAELATQSGTPTVKVVNGGSTAITSLKVDLTYNGSTTTQNVTGVNIPTAGVYNVSLPSTVLAAGTLPINAVVYNVNGGAGDNTPSNDTLIELINPIVPAPGKMVVGEEATGTWCQWCPRGAVFMDLFETKYQDFWAGIAVHNGDPMTVEAYDTGIGTLIGGYPSALVDRLGDVDPSGMSSDFFTRLQTAPKATLVNGATWDANSRVLNVSVRYNFALAANGNYKSACVLTEDGVTGTGAGWSQSNAYASGNNGVMGGYESLPSPVPAAQMVYDHVARAIAPSFTGMTGIFPATVNAGDAHIVNYSFTLPAGWDENEIQIIGLLIDPTGKIDNAGSVDINTAVANGYETGLNAGIAQVLESSRPVALAPNPANGTSAILMNLTTESEVHIELSDLNGKLITSGEYTNLFGAQSIAINLNGLSAGMYAVNILINGTLYTEKLIVE